LGDDPFPAVPVGYAVLFAQFIEQLPAAYAEACL
jgi:hypothetical protein